MLSEYTVTFDKTQPPVVRSVPKARTQQFPAPHPVGSLLERIIWFSLTCFPGGVIVPWVWAGIQKGLNMAGKKIRTWAATVEGSKSKMLKTITVFRTTRQAAEINVRQLATAQTYFGNEPVIIKTLVQR